ncbi:ABC transporter ATP-binding protein [Aerococcus viridans]|uniref:ABC transporter ATP-binding protein n=1 Tax=Aerococcus viridans TaxID=1377 RepID=UPI0037F277A7
MKGIKINHLYKDYIPGQHAVTDFNLEIAEGEFIVLVGPSGCGKSTTLRMIAGLEDITSGELVLEGEVVTDYHPKDRNIAMVFQDYALYPHMTVRENMSFGLKMKNVNKEEISQRVDKAAETIDLTEYLNRIPKELSGGQRQRVALGRAIVREPKAFLMDEPLSNLDAKLRVQTRAQISKLARTLGITTIYVTHDQVEAMTMADRIVVMDKGFIQQVGTPKEIYLRPNNKFVAGFMGSPAMNFIDVNITDQGIERNGKIMPIPENVKAFLMTNGYANKTITLGIRPENIELYREASEEVRAFRYTTVINVAEMLGSESLLHFDVIGQPMVAKINSLEDFYPEQEERICFDFDFVHFFDPSTGNRIDVPEHGRYNHYLAQKAEV